MNKTVYWVVGVLLIAGLTGCSADAAAIPEPAMVPSPIADEASSSSDEPTPEVLENGKTVEEFMLEVFADGAWHGTMPSGEELASAAELVCEQLRSGVPQNEVRGVEGDSEDADWNNAQLVIAAIQAVCPEFF